MVKLFLTIGIIGMAKMAKKGPHQHRIIYVLLCHPSTPYFPWIIHFTCYVHTWVMYVARSTRHVSIYLNLVQEKKNRTHKHTLCTIQAFTFITKFAPRFHPNERIIPYNGQMKLINPTASNDNNAIVYQK